jgi:hypothetical protein
MNLKRMKTIIMTGLMCFMANVRTVFADIIGNPHPIMPPKEEKPFPILLIVLAVIVITLILIIVLFKNKKNSK